jgi:hypothetical protein
MTDHISNLRCVSAVLIPDGSLLIVHVTVRSHLWQFWVYPRAARFYP